MDHIAGVIGPATQQGTTVISDRYVLSSMAYQGLHLSFDWLLEINRYAMKPDLTVFLDVPPAHTQARLRSSRLTKEANDEPTQQDRVHESYRRFIREHSGSIGRIETIDASKPIQAVRRQIRSLVDSLMERGPASTVGFSLFDGEVV
jgi:dTMP kinase